MTDHELADAVQKAIANLNEAVATAARSGLRIEINMIEAESLADNWPRPILIATISREIE